MSQQADLSGASEQGSQLSTQAGATKQFSSASVGSIGLSGLASLSVSNSGSGVDSNGHSLVRTLVLGSSLNTFDYNIRNRIHQ